MSNAKQDQSNPSNGKPRHLPLAFVVLALVVVAIAPVWAQAGSATQRVEGRVLQIRHGADGSGQLPGTMDRVMLQTRDRQRLEIAVPAGSLGEQVMVGDRVRAMVHTIDGQGTALAAQSMQVRRTGQTLHFGGPGMSAAAEGMPGAMGGTHAGNCAQDPASCSGGAMGQGAHDAMGAMGGGAHQGGASHGGMGSGGAGGGMGAGHGGAGGGCPGR